MFQGFYGLLCERWNEAYVRTFQSESILFPIELTHLHDGDITIYPNVHELLDRVFFARAERDRVKQQAGDLERWLQNEIDKLALKTKS